VWCELKVPSGIAPLKDVHEGTEHIYNIYIYIYIYIYLYIYIYIYKLYCKGLAACAADLGFSEFLMEFVCEDASGAIEALFGSHSEEIWTPWGTQGSPRGGGFGEGPGSGG